MRKKGLKKRKKLIALLSAVAVLAAGGIGTGVAFAAIAAVRKPSLKTSSVSSPSSLSPSSFKELYFKAEGEKGQKVKEVKFLLTSPSSASSPSPSSFSVSKGSTVSYSKKGDLVDLTHEENGVFSFEAKPGKYDITLQGGKSEEGKSLTYGSYYFAPSFEADLIKDGETLTSLSDPFGFVNPKEKEVIVGAQNPSSERVEGNKLSSSSFASLPGSSHPYSYQIESFLPFAQSGVNAKGNRASLIPLTFSLSLKNQTLVKKSIEVNSIPLSSLMGSSLSSSSSSSVKLALSPLALKTIEEKGKSPLPSSSLLTQEGNTDRQLSITFEAYLSPTSKGSPSQASAKASSKTSSSPSTFEFEYQAWKGEEPKGKEGIVEPTVSTLVSGKKGAVDKTPARSVLSSSSSYQGLPCVGEDGKPLKQVTVLLANPASGGDGYSIPYVFTDSANIPSGDIGLPQGSTVTASYQGDTVTFEGSDITIFNSSAVPVQLTPISGVNQEGQSVSYGSYYVAPQLYLSFTSSAVSATVQVWSPFLDYSPQGNVTQIEVGATNPEISRVDGSSLSSSAFTATVGSSNPYTYQATAFLPYGYGDDDINSGNSFLPDVPLTFSLSIPGQNVIMNSIKINGLSLLSLLEAGGGFPSESGSDFSMQITPPELSLIESQGSLPFPGSGSLTQNGITNHTLSVEWNAYLDPSFTSSSNATFAFYYEDLVGNQGQAESSGSAMPITPEVSTNGPADNSVPSSLSSPSTSLPTSSPSSETGLWFENAFENPKDNQCGIQELTGSHVPTEFTVQEDSPSSPNEGEYLNPAEDNGTFEGWQWSSSPYDFEKRNSSGVYEWGGLADGTYKITNVEYPTLSFTGTLSYSSPEALNGQGSSGAKWTTTVQSSNGPLTANYDASFNWYLSGGYLIYSDVQVDSEGAAISFEKRTGTNLSVATGDVCSITPGGTAPPSPTPASVSHLPLTGGKGILGLSLAACFLFLLGLGVWWGIAKKRKNSRSGRHGF